MAGSQVRLCTVEGCGRRHLAKGYCTLHYARVKRLGSPTGLKNAPRGTGSVRPDGYRAFRRKGVETLEHRELAERALGRKLPPGAEVHHWDGIRDNNRTINLVICPDRAYHQLLHQRQRALEACGNASWLKCNYCKQYDKPQSLKSYTSKKNCTHTYHAQCKRDRMRAAYHNKGTAK